MGKEGSSKGRGYVYIWHKPTQDFKAVILKLKIKLKMGSGNLDHNS